MGNPITKIIKAARRWRELRTMPLRLEFVVTDYCNLNCRGCTHYSPLAAKEFADLKVLEASMKHLAEICGDTVKKAYLIGGETLLYPHINEAMQALRRCFPKQELYIFTNGIALPKMSDEFWHICSDLDIIMAITRYPIRFDYDAVIDLCRNRGVRCEVFGDRSMADSFFRFALDPSKSQNAKVSHFKCYNRGCMSIVDNYLYPCSISACVGHLNKACGTKFEHVDGDRLEIDRIGSLRQVLDLRDRPVPFCGYCKNPPSTVPYGPSRRNVAEWVDLD